MKVEHNGDYAVVALFAGSPKHPVWYHNLKANPHVELAGRRCEGDDIAREVIGEEKIAWWTRAVAAYPPFADYQLKTERIIPVLCWSQCSRAISKVRESWTGNGEVARYPRQESNLRPIA